MKYYDLWDKTDYEILKDRETIIKDDILFNHYLQKKRMFVPKPWQFSLKERRNILNETYNFTD